MKTINTNSIYESIMFHKELKEDVLCVFIVDDDLFYLNYLKANLSKDNNIKVFTFISGESCLHYLYMKPDLVILDYHLNDKNKDALDGAEIYNQIKKISPTTKVRIVSGDKKVKFNIKDIEVYRKNQSVLKRINGILRLQWQKKATQGKIRLVIEILLFVVFIFFLFKMLQAVI